jgi:DNA-binding MarR family transcriptional regulator
VRQGKLSDLQALVLAIFMYGLADTPADVAQALRMPVADATALCEQLSDAGLIDGEGLVADRRRRAS